MIDFKPSHVVLRVPPLTATMGKAEIEAAASMLVRVCHALGDEWQSVTWQQIADVMREDMASKREPFASMLTNPFFRPDIHAAIARDFMGGDPKGEVAFTMKGLEALRRWVAPERAAKGGA